MLVRFCHNKPETTIATSLVCLSIRRAPLGGGFEAALATNFPPKEKNAAAGRGRAFEPSRSNQHRTANSVLCSRSRG